MVFILLVDSKRRAAIRQYIEITLKIVPTRFCTNDFFRIEDNLFFAFFIMKGRKMTEGRDMVIITSGGDAISAVFFWMRLSTVRTNEEIRVITIPRSIFKVWGDIAIMTPIKTMKIPRYSDVCKCSPSRKYAKRGVQIRRSRTTIVESESSVS